MIRLSLLGLLVATDLLTAMPVSAQTGVSQYPFCIQGVDNPGWSGCSFNTLPACQAAASGTEAECLANPCFQAPLSSITSHTIPASVLIE